MDLVDLTPEREEGSDDGTGACPEDDIEPLVERAAQHPFNLFQDAERVEALCSSAIEAKHPTETVLGWLAVQRLGARNRLLLFSNPWSFAGHVGFEVELSSAGWGNFLIRISG